MSAVIVSLVSLAVSAWFALLSATFNDGMGQVSGIELTVAQAGLCSAYRTEVVDLAGRGLSVREIEDILDLEPTTLSSRTEKMVDSSAFRPAYSGYFKGRCGTVRRITGALGK